jgi:hypothetical protein
MVPAHMMIDDPTREGHPLFEWNEAASPIVFLRMVEAWTLLLIGRKRREEG